MTIGGSQLVVGAPDQLKVHVHTDDPSERSGYALSLGEVAEVHVNNMRRQTADRARRIRAESQRDKPIGFVAVAAGDGLAEILRSLGVDVVVSGGQTMNPSTAELLDAIAAVPAQRRGRPSEQPQHHHGRQPDRRHRRQAGRRRAHDLGPRGVQRDARGRPERLARGERGRR